MSTETETTVQSVPPASPPVTVDHINGLHKRLDELWAFIKSGFHEVVSVVEKAAPVLEAGAAAVAKAVPAAGAAAGVVGKVASAAASLVASCCSHTISEHGPRGCSSAGCSCTLTRFGAKNAS